MDGNTRRLPPWMLAGASSDVPAKNNLTDKKSVEVKRKHEPEEAPRAKAEKRPRRIVKPKEKDDSEESKEMGIKRRGEERSKIGEEEEAKPSICVGKNQEISQSVTGPKDEEDLTVDDLLSFAHEYVKCEEDRTIKDREPMVIVDESNTTSSQSQGGGTKEPNQIRDQTAQDMLSLLLGPYFKKPHQ